MARAVELIVEDGTGVADANSFVTEDQIVAYAAARGVTLANATDADKDAVAVLGIQAMDYLNSLAWKGTKTYPDSLVPFPRTGLTGYTDTQIPAAIKQAQMQLAVIANSGVVLVPSIVGGSFIKREKIGPIETEYSESVYVSDNGLPLLPGIAALLNPFLIGELPDGVPAVDLWALGC